MHKNNAFTLVELSIVIVIIGLIVAGVMAGQSLVRQAQLRSVISDFQQYETAFNTFRLQYNAVPGDMANAWSYWPGAQCGNNSQNNCNGDGNGFLRFEAIPDVSAVEDTVAWQHMALAGVIPGSWTWESNARILNRNIIPGSMTNTGYWLWSPWQIWGTTILTLGSARTTDIYFNGESVRPTEALSIDMKMDDGHPRRGRTTTLRDQDRWSEMICIDKAHNAADLDQAAFLLSDTGITCTISYTLK